MMVDSKVTYFYIVPPFLSTVSFHHTVCTASCGLAGCKDSDWGSCCDASCLGGCDAAGVCHACAVGYLKYAQEMHIHFDTNT